MAVATDLPVLVDIRRAEALVRIPGRGSRHAAAARIPAGGQHARTGPGGA
jgi:hypothetical protein